MACRGSFILIVKQLLLKNKRIGLVTLFLFVLFLPASAEAVSPNLGPVFSESEIEGYRGFTPKSDQAYNYSKPCFNETRETISSNMNVY